MSDPRFIKVKDHPELVRDMRSNAILNTDKDALAKYREEREYKKKVAKVIEDMRNFRDELSEIKDLLRQIVKK